MGIEADATKNTLGSFFNGREGEVVRIEDLPVLNGSVTLEHAGSGKTTLTNSGKNAVSWMAKFSGRHEHLMVGKKSQKASFKQDAKTYPYSYSYVLLEVAPGEKISVSKPN